MLTPFNGPSVPVNSNHFSTSSSVYLPVEEKFSENGYQNNPNQRYRQSKLQNTVFERERQNSNGLDSLPMLAEHSSNTITLYVTADNSFKSYKSDSQNSMDLNTTLDLDTDATPIIRQDAANYLDPVEKTPIIGEDSEFLSNGVNSHNSYNNLTNEVPLISTNHTNNNIHSNGSNINSKFTHLSSGNQLNLPIQDLPKKFKRLSMTLQSSSQQPNDYSQQFISLFQQNVNEANNDVNRKSIDPTNRKSVYYQKIYETEEGDEENNQRMLSRHSIASTVSDWLAQLSLTDTQSNSLSLHLSNNQDHHYENENRVNSNNNITNRFDLLDIGNNKEGEEKGLNISYQASHSNSKARESVQMSEISTEDSEDLLTLFIKALHTFDSSSLQSEQDISICLSFEKNDLAFVHTIDESGWGEVTLISSLKRGWIPMNYFTLAIAEDEGDKNKEDDEEDSEEDYLENGHYLRTLFRACAAFLINPLSHRNRRGKYTFSVRVINSIRDGVRLLLQETDCLSRLNEIVTKRPIVRKIRKALLADWYNLMVKANLYKGTYNFDKIEILTLMIFQVLQKAIEFLQIWLVELRFIVKKEKEKKLNADLSSYPLLDEPPMAKGRINELNGILYLYLGMIIGRLDIVEHNPTGCELLESIAHQVILLLRELLFISKTGLDFLSEKPADLDSSLDTLLLLVSELVLGVKTLVIRTLNEIDEDKQLGQDPLKDYYYTKEGGDLLVIASKMVGSIGRTINSIRRLLNVTGDFRLSAERSYPDYAKIRIEPEELVKKCLIGIATQRNLKGGIPNKQKRDEPNAKSANNNSLTVPGAKKQVQRFSMIRTGKSGNLGFTDEGSQLIQTIMDADEDENTPFSRNAAFEKFAHSEGTIASSDRHNITDQLLVDSQGNLLGASFKGLIYTLTNENSPPEYFFVSTFFICFRSFASGIDLIEELLNRFEINRPEDPEDLSFVPKLKVRRRLIAKMFQIWLELYWSQEADYSLLTTLINFFNECLSNFLPVDAIKLIEVVAKLSSKPLIENAPQKSQANKQIVSRKITVLRKTNSIALSVDSNILARYSMVDGYELSKIDTNLSINSSMTSLPMPLGVGNQTSSSQLLLSKSQVSTLEKLNLTYRAILGEAWCEAKYLDTKNFHVLDIKSLLPKWYNICDQQWVLLNYRPNLLDFNGLEIAKQLTLIELQIFCSVRPEELLNDNFSAKRANLKLAPNVRQLLLFTNCLSEYVLELTLQPNIPHKFRVNIIKTWLKVSILCLYLRNFNSLAAILTALQLHLVTRLGSIWHDISPKYRDLYDYLLGIVHPDKNYNVYRNKLRNFLVANEYNIPIVPYFSLFLQDLTFVTEGNPNYRKADSFLNQKLINIDKYLKITRIIADIELLQIPFVGQGQVQEKRSSLLLFGKSEKVEEYSIIPVPALQELILLELWKVSQLNRKEDDRAWKLSCMVQPRDAHAN